MALKRKELLATLAFGALLLGGALYLKRLEAVRRAGWSLPDEHRWRIALDAGMGDYEIRAGLRDSRGSN